MKILIVACGLVAVISCGEYRNRERNYDNNNYAPSKDYNTRANYNQDSGYNHRENGYGTGGMSMFDLFSNLGRYNNNNNGYGKESYSSESYSSSGSHEKKKKCERCRRVKTTTFVLPQALIASITSLPQQTTPEIKYFFDKGCKKAIITCPHTPGNTNNFYLLVRTDPSPSLENQLPTDAAAIAYGKRATAVVECDGKNWKANRLTDNAKVKFTEVSCYADPNPCAPAPLAPALGTPIVSFSDSVLPPQAPGAQLFRLVPALTDETADGTAKKDVPAKTSEKKQQKKEKIAKLAMASPVAVRALLTGGGGG